LINKRKIINSIVPLLIFLLIELLLRGYSYFNIFRFYNYPLKIDSSFVADLNRDFGVWHYSNYRYRHRQSCFDVIYETNSYGAKDKERSKLNLGNKKRIIILGDSYSDGYGVNDSERFSNILENISGFEHLNFSSGGSFGSIQEMLLYKTLASKFEHTDVFIFFSPDTDFGDNRVDSSTLDRYRPYMKKTNGSYELFYTVKFEDRNKNYFLRNIGYSESLYNYLCNNLYCINIIRMSVRDLFLSYEGDKNNKMGNISNISWNKTYYNDEDMNLLLYTYEQIKKFSEDKNVFIFIVPTRQIFEYYYNNGYNFDLISDIQNYDSKNKGLMFIDLLPLLNNYLKNHNLKFEDLYLSCDEHFTPLGNKAVADAIYNSLFIYR
jgi:hypothetical protein